MRITGRWSMKKRKLYGKKNLTVPAFVAALLMSACGGMVGLAAAAGTAEPAGLSTAADDAGQTEVASEDRKSADIIEMPFAQAADDGPVIGIAWREDTDSEFYTNIVSAVEEAGGVTVLLDQVMAREIAYDEDGHVAAEAVDENGYLTQEAADMLKEGSWQQSNAEDILGEITAVIFTGGEDISPTLYAVPQAWHGIEAEKDYNATRDVSDYLLMRYCIDEDVTVMGFCRGMQMLCTVSGGTVIQDIPTWFEEQGLDYDYEHRNEVTAGEYRDYAPHDVEVAEGSILWDIVGTAVLHDVPSWHHQAVGSVDGTELALTGTATVSGIEMIEAVERKDKTCIVGFQFHPEAAVVKHLEGAANSGDFMDADTALGFFTYLVEQAEINEAGQEVATAA